MRKGRIDLAYYAKRASGSATANAPPAAVWQVVSAIGGENRYYYMNSLWAMRELMDWVVGGPGLKRGRRNAQELRVGDQVDSWKVVGVEPERRLTMAFGMRAPGSGILEFVIDPLESGRSRVTATAYWHPAGVLGLAYWYSLELAHQFIFRGLTQEIARRAETHARRPTLAGDVGADAG
jgi:hypothetical protein